ELDPRFRGGDGSSSSRIAAAIFLRAAIPADEDAGDDRHKEQDFEDEVKLHARSLCSSSSRVARMQDLYHGASLGTAALFRVFAHACSAGAVSDAPITLAPRVRLS